MIKRPFFSLMKPRLYYSTIDATDKEISIVDIPIPPKITLLLEQDHIRPSELYGYIGKRVRTGQKIKLKDTHFISTATGDISQVSEYIGYLGRRYHAVSIETTEDEWEEAQTDIPFAVPGFKDISVLLGFDPPINHVVVMAIDKDLCITTNQVALINRKEEIKKGIEYLHKIASIGRISFAVPPSLISHVEDMGYDFYVIKPLYPNAIPKLIVKNIFGEVVPPGKDTKDIGIEFISAEAVANLGSLSEGKLILDKLITIIKKDSSSIYVKARIGTPIKNIFDVLDIDISYGDRIIIGGPMNGRTVYSLDTPVDYDTDAIFIQDKNQIIPVSDTHCINCGECIKICPVNIPVNMLVRVLENGLFEEAAKEYDLLCCVECGLCSYVCIARIPIFHYIMLGKYELSKMGETNA